MTYTGLVLSSSGPDGKKSFLLLTFVVLRQDAIGMAQTLHILIYFWSLIYGLGALANEEEIRPATVQSQTNKADYAPQETQVPRVVLDSNPFWRAKDAYRGRLHKERRILVSVRSVEESSLAATQLLRLHGAGHTSVTRIKAFEVASSYENLHQAHSSIKKSEFDSEQGLLSMQLSLFRRQLALRMRIQGRHNEENSEIRFQVIDGFMKGATGVFLFTDLDQLGFKSRGTEISMTAYYAYDQLPLPDFITYRGLEVVLQRIASGMRDYIEAESLLAREGNK